MEKRNTFQVSNALFIGSPPESVWAVTIDIDRIPDWAPTVEATRPLDKSKIGVGSQYELKQPGQPIAIWTVTQLQPEKLFAWRKRLLGMDLTGIHEIEPCRQGSRNTLIVEASGFTAIFLFPLLRPLLIRAITKENAGLKTYCEERHPSG